MVRKRTLTSGLSFLIWRVASKLLKPGSNHVEIHVYNTALNAWSAQPPHDYKSLIAKYGDRFQMQDLDKVMPISSGLLGRVLLVTQSSK